MLRTRIFLNLIPFVVILIAVGVYALYLFSRLATDVERTVTDNYRIESATQSMDSTLTRMDIALQRSLTEDREPVKLMFDTNARLFDESLASQFTNSAMTAQMNVLTQLRTNFHAFQALSLQMFDPQKPRSEQRTLYEGRIVPHTLAINLLIGRIRNANRENSFAIGRTLQNLNGTITNLLILGLVLALIITAYGSFKLGKSILEPIKTLTEAAREIGRGNLELTVPVLSQDELGDLATTFNNMAGQLNTYRQSTTEQIIRLHRTMEAALASFSDPVFIVDRSGRIELKNRAAQELSAQLSLEGGLPPRLAAAAEAALQSQQDFLPDSFADVHTLRVQNEERSFLPRLHIMREADAKVVGVAMVLHDVTRFRLLDDAKTNLVATVSHELKTPLTSIRMVLHMLLEKGLGFGSLTTRQTKLVETARNDSERLLRILDSLLDIARLEAGGSSLAREPIHPADLVQGIVQEIRTTVQNLNLQIVTDIQPGLPAVTVDRVQIGHVFHNFISNAIKHSPPGGTIRLAALGDEESGVEFSVRDEGPGVTEAFQSRVFDRFFRVPGQGKTGVGLGLSIAREIVVAHGGRVGLRSRPGQGSEFFFVLDAVGH
jgi:two-component system, NtrC family, sensor histidine kinase KinB